MKTSIRFLRMLAAAAVALSMVIVPSIATTSKASDNLVYFPETGHNLSWGFKYYWENHGGLEAFGYPITEEFQEQNAPPPAGDGKLHTVQYFERARFEYHEELKGTPYETLLGLLGSSQTLYRRGDPAFRPIDPSTVPSDKTYFSETGHSLGGAFKEYWNEYGGLMQFGYPISEELPEKNPAPPAGDGQWHMVQHFERARFEYHPENAGTKYEVLLGLLGWKATKDNHVPEYALKKALPADSPIPSFPMQGPHVGYGMNVQLYYQDQDRVLGLVKAAGFDWVRQQVRWEHHEAYRGGYAFGELDNVVNAAVRNNVHLILDVVGSPSWATSNGGHGMPADPNDLKNFMSALASRYKGAVDAYEIWNEENLAGESSSGQVNPAEYVSVLKAGYEGVKSGYPWAPVIFGGLTPTSVTNTSVALDDVQYLDQIYKVNNGEVKNYFDVLGAHPGSNNNPPDDFYCPAGMAYCPDGGVVKRGDVNAGWRDQPSFFFRRIEQLRNVMVNYGDGNKQMWLTEFGWTTANQAPGYEYGAQNSEQNQADYLVRAFQKGKNEYPWMGVMSMWQLNFATVVSASDEKSPWGLIRADWSPRPSYTALQNMPK